MKILITGGTTFVSKYTAEYFVSKNNEVYVINRNSKTQIEGLKDEFEWYKNNLDSIYNRKPYMEYIDKNLRKH